MASDPSDGRYAPEIIKHYYPSRRERKSRKLRQNVKFIINPSHKFKANVREEDISTSEDPVQSFDQTSTLSSPIKVNNPIDSSLQIDSPESLTKLRRQVINSTENLISKNEEPLAAVKIPEISNTAPMPLNSLKDYHIKPISLVELCLRMINSVEEISILKKRTLKATKEHTTFQTKGNSKAVGNSPSVDNFYEEMGCYIAAEEVVLLKDFLKEPSLNTLIRQDNIQQCPSMSPTSTLNFDLLPVIDSPQNLYEPLDIISSCSEDPMLGHISPCSGIGDYSPDNEDSDYRSNELLRQSSSESEDINMTDGKRRRSKRGKANKESWISEANKYKRMKGDTYAGRRKTEEGKVIFDVPRRKRSVELRCCHTENSKYFQCHKVTDENRQSNFN
ncbi:unnamed protein product, partial [Brenthis ino]